MNASRTDEMMRAVQRAFAFEHAPAAPDLVPR
jgi:hypothetical protein